MIHRPQHTGWRYWAETGQATRRCRSRNHHPVVAKLGFMSEVAQGGGVGRREVRQHDDVDRNHQSHDCGVGCVRVVATGACEEGENRGRWNSSEALWVDCSPPSEPPAPRRERAGQGQMGRGRESGVVGWRAARTRPPRPAFVPMERSLLRHREVACGTAHFGSTTVRETRAPRIRIRDRLGLLHSFCSVSLLLIRGK